jgi:tetratricopeptide (TPR) repeat protein
MRFFGTVFGVIVASILVAGPVAAAAGDGDRMPEWDACNGSAPQYPVDEQIAACTKIIESGQQTTRNLAIAYYNRGFSYDDKDELEFALADYTRSIALDPNYASPYVERCRTRAVLNRDLNDALADCNKAISLNYSKPHLPMTSRGIVYYRFGQWDNAIGAFDAALRIKPDHHVAIFIRGCAKRRKGNTAEGDADIAAAKAMSSSVADFWGKYGITP